MKNIFTSNISSDSINGDVSCFSYVLQLYTMPLLKEVGRQFPGVCVLIWNSLCLQLHQCKKLKNGDVYKPNMVNFISIWGE